MPRPSKAIKRQRLQAADALKHGDRKKAYELWAAADKARKDRQAKKRTKKTSDAE